MTVPMHGSLLFPRSNQRRPGLPPRLFSSTLRVAWAISVLLLLTSRPALAQQALSDATATVVLQTAYPGESSFLLAAGGTIAADASGVSGDSSQDWEFVNRGDISAGENGGTGSGIVLGSLTAGNATVTNYWTIASATIQSNGPSGVQFTKGGQVYNAFGATISGFDGIHADGGNLEVQNEGDISGRSAGSTIYLGLGGTVRNLAGGRILGAGYGINSNANDRNVVIENDGIIDTDDQAIKLYNGNIYALRNTGTITSGGGATVDIEGATGYVLNQGTITAQNIGIRSQNSTGGNVYVNAGDITTANGPAMDIRDTGNVIYNLQTATTGVAGGDVIRISGSDNTLVLG